MILTTVAQSRRHFLTLYDVNTQFKPRDVLADCVYWKIAKQFSMNYKKALGN